ncbi:hypothetical protein Bca52824_033720 [Brassica carinata]|uniref:Uncharacterized protein n=1 Tax=Brassica carinata TaxID=52824 RepID=A0A8X7V7B8_BRACI|nr:hypothetical protein Bca52824_033720 [Brassica carinata]
MVLSPTRWFFCLTPNKGISPLVLQTRKGLVGLWYSHPRRCLQCRTDGNCFSCPEWKGLHVHESSVVKTGVPQTYPYAKRGNAWLIGAPFLLIVLGTIGLGGIKANRAYNMQKQTFPSHNPFLP